LTAKPAFWDSSSIVPLCFRESATPACFSLYQKFSVVVWWGTFVESHGAFSRLVRTGHLTADKEIRSALRRFDDLRASWLEIPPTDRVRDQAIALLDLYSLRAADALQLAAALEWRAGNRSTADFISGDHRVLVAARAEGFVVHSTA
jgi:predicted nucleic acid-binding protein